MIESTVQTDSENKRDSKYALIAIVGKPSEDPKIKIVYTADFWGEYQEARKNIRRKILEDKNGYFSFGDSPYTLSDAQMKILGDKDLINRLNDKPLSQVYGELQGLLGKLDEAGKNVR